MQSNSILMCRTNIIVALIILLSFCSLNLSAQTDSEIISRLLSKEQDSFIHGRFEETLKIFSTIQSVSLEYPNEATRIAIKACNELINSSNDSISKEQLVIKKHALKNILFLQEKVKSEKDKLTDGSVPISEFRKNYNQNAVYQKGAKFLKGGEKIKYEEFKRILCSYEDSEREFDSYKKNTMIGGLLFTGTLVSYTIALLVSKKNPNLAGGLGITGFALNIAAIPFMSKGRNHLNMATWHYNREAAISPN